MENMPRDGACLLVSNHQSHLDPPLVAMASPRRHVHFVARVGLFKNSLFAKLIRSLNAIAIRQDAGDLAAIRQVLSRLELGAPVLMFPEGSRTPDGSLQEFKRGIGLLVKRAKCPVVPVAVEGCFDAWPRSQGLPTLFGKRVAVMIGTPIPHAELLRDGPDEALRKLAREIESLRLQLRAKMRSATNGRFPAPGHGDTPTNPAGWYSDLESSTAPQAT